jgi:hypothetical protein
MHDAPRSRSASPGVEAPFLAWLARSMAQSNWSPMSASMVQTSSIALLSFSATPWALTKGSMPMMSMCKVSTISRSSGPLIEADLPRCRQAGTAGFDPKPTLRVATSPAPWAPAVGDWPDPAGSDPDGLQPPAAARCAARSVASRFLRHADRFLDQFWRVSNHAARCACVCRHHA